MSGTSPQIPDDVLERAVAVLRGGGLLLYPTDTIWGIGCDPFNAEAVDRVFQLKRRPREKAFILLVDGVDMLREYVTEIPDEILPEIDVPGRPLTVVYAKTRLLPGHLLAGDGSVAIRVVQHAAIRRLIDRFGFPIVSTSANTSGQPAPSFLDQVEPEIRLACDLTLPESLDTSEHRHPSPVVLVGADGGVVRLR